MKLPVILLLLASSVSTEDRKAFQNRKSKNNSQTEKRALVEGNAALERRVSVQTLIPAVTPGIEYADSNEVHRDTSPTQQIYATPVPRVAKISDVLTGQGTPFQTAITRHLYSPVSVYQPRLASPTTYEVSSPVASQLAYSEHKIMYQPQNTQYTSQHAQSAGRATNYVRTINRPVPAPQQIFVQQPVYQTALPTPQQAPQQTYQQIPQNYQPRLTYSVQPVAYTAPTQNYQNEGQVSYLRQVQAQPGITYKTQEPEEQKSSEQEQKNQETQSYTSGQNYNNNGAVSYASFSLSQPQHEQYRHTPQQTQPQATENREVSTVTSPTKSGQLVYFRNGPVLQQQLYQLPQGPPQQQQVYTQAPQPAPGPVQQQFYSQPHHPQGPVQQQVYTQVSQTQNSGSEPQELAPTFPPIQYFGKFAQSIFGGYQH